MRRAAWPACFDTFFHALIHVGGDVQSGGAGSGTQWKAKCPAHEDTVQSLSIGMGRNGNLILRCHAPAGCTADEICKACGVTLRDLYPDEVERKRYDEERRQKEIAVAAAESERCRERDVMRLYRGADGFPEVDRRPKPATPADTAIPEKFLDRPKQNPQPKAGKTVSGKKVVKVYDYRDERGNLVFQVCRTDPKGFYQRRPNPAFDGTQPEDYASNPRFVNNLQGVSPILYRVPDMLAAWAAKPTRGVFIVEGEKDADLLHAAGLLGTTNCGGAGKWRPEYTEFLRGRAVVIIPDEDPVNEAGYSPGVRHAQEVAHALYGVASSVRILRLPGLPPKGDFTDWWTLNSNPAETIDQTKAKFGKLVTDCPPFVPDPNFVRDAKPAAATAQPAIPGTLPPVTPPAPVAPPPPPPPPPPPVPPVAPVVPPQGGSAAAPPQTRPPAAVAGPASVALVSPPIPPAPVAPPTVAVSTAVTTLPTEGKTAKITSVESGGLKAPSMNTFRFLEHAESAAATMTARGVAVESVGELLVTLQAGVRRLEAAVHAHVYGHTSSDPAAEVAYALGMIGGAMLLGIDHVTPPAK